MIAPLRPHASHRARIATWLGCLALLLPAASARAEYEILDQQVDNITKSNIRVTTPFDRVPARGFLPLTITIRNNFPQERTWNVTFRSEPPYAPMEGTRFFSSYAVKTPGLSETDHQFMVPIASRARRNMESELRVSIQSGRLSARGEHPGSAHPNWISVGFSHGLDGRNSLDKLSAAIRKTTSEVHSGDPVASVFHPETLPADWRAYHGFDAFLMSTAEWTALDPSVRQTLKSWVQMGGGLFLFSEREPGAEPAPSPSFGQIYQISWNGLDLPVNRVTGPLKNQTGNQLEALREQYQRFGLRTAFGRKNFNPLLVFLILVAFAVIVGPVNLFVWAKPGQRHRLFITTPLISLSASLLLFLIILFGDGIGGSGQRIGFMLLKSEPEERRAYLVQEQISRTGVLMGRGFKLEESAFLSPAVMQKSRWTHFDAAGDFDATFRLSGGKLGGDWFRSRSEQTHLAQAVIPTRARIEVIPPAPGAPGEAPPVLFASLDYGLKRLFYIDEDGAVWDAEGPIASGAKVTMAPSSTQDFQEWWDASTGDFTQLWRNRIRSLQEEKGLFFASIDRPGKQLLPTLPSIRWRDDVLLLAGRPEGRAAAGSPSPNPDTPAVP